jgi:hypothetical protein
MSAMIGELAFRFGSTGTLIEGSIGLKHRNLGEAYFLGKPTIAKRGMSDLS